MYIYFNILIIWLGIIGGTIYCETSDDRDSEDKGNDTGISSSANNHNLSSNNSSNNNSPSIDTSTKTNSNDSVKREKGIVESTCRWWCQNHIITINKNSKFFYL